MKKQLKYTKELAKQMYLFFSGYDDPKSAPGFVKFAKSIGSSAIELEAFRQHKEFDLAWRVCDEIRRDYLTDRALTKQFDPSFVKFLLSEGNESDDKNESIAVHIKVIDGEN